MGIKEDKMRQNRDREMKRVLGVYKVAPTMDSLTHPLPRLLHDTGQGAALEHRRRRHSFVERSETL